MKIVIAPDKFKGSLTGFEFCDAVEMGLQTVLNDAEIVKAPLADGGDGTIEVVRHYLEAEKATLEVNDPLCRPISASYLYSETAKIAYIEMAEASGLKLLHDDKRDTMQATSLGTGQLIADALDKGAQEIILGIGGSATTDGGMGMAAALGFRFLNAQGNELQPIGENLIQVQEIDSSQAHARLKTTTVKVACDVKNPLYGKKGAAFVYAAQKGATKENIITLDEGLKRFARVIKNHYGIDPQKIKGGGAAGGMGAGAHVFLGAELISGIDLIKDLASFDTLIKGADWIITGEGQLDSQTLSGKTIDGVISSARKHKIPVAALCGSVDISIKEQEALGLSYAVSITKGVVTLQNALKSSRDNLTFAAYNFARLIQGL
ncbi:glycerate kinase [Pareuzebyella sediminis]|uniref:glycerate kinase n=1 Tax=Pareuzebyella sediminis TaxID=2607998 RepID=UPI0011F043C5|nr:glycerate kinase [Pareuzebyella sediminis]